MGGLPWEKSAEAIVVPESGDEGPNLLLQGASREDSMGVERQQGGPTNSRCLRERRRPCAPAQAVKAEPGEERGGPGIGTEVPGAPAPVWRTGGPSARKPEAREGEDTENHAAQPGHKPRRDNPRAELLPHGVGDLLPLCGMPDPPKELG